MDFLIDDGYTGNENTEISRWQVPGVHECRPPRPSVNRGNRAASLSGILVSGHELRNCHYPATLRMPKDACTYLIDPPETKESTVRLLPTFDLTLEAFGSVIDIESWEK